VNWEDRRILENIGEDWRGLERNGEGTVYMRIGKDYLLI
jgi:hypothetical protein